ncbi:hypothetical protein Vau01_043990 [Virgisporangium aurantiacum]|uniref:Neutral/alkaline non-lysosomal ceramidase, N-terminal n=2 Tax=Virgisporangium aurantiacum TaxID=175570 RepID=A0A8J3Z5U0_9ACTN|nr:hypothetical protein Vau01_043990 [Virgisporangium aurantiacum]
MLLLSHGAVDVTPPPGHPMGGYAARDGNATGHHDDLRLTLVWLAAPDDDGVVWLAVDALAMPAPVATALASTVGAGLGIDADRILVCASHTHCAPAGWHGELHPPDGTTVDADLVAELRAAAGRLAAAVAAQDRLAVTAAWCAPEVAGVSANRLADDGPADRSAGTLVLRDRATGAVAAVLLDFADHATSLGPDCRAWSADWPAAARDVLGAALAAAAGFAGVGGRPPTIAVLQGAAGDVSPRAVRRGRGFAETARLGSVLAGSVLAALHRDATPVPGAAVPPGVAGEVPPGVAGVVPPGVAGEVPGGAVPPGAAGAVPAGVGPVVRRAVVRLPTRPLPDVDTAEAVLAGAEREWRAVTVSAGLPADGPVARRALARRDGAAIQVRLAGAVLPAALDLPIAVVRLGDIAWAHLPVEPFASVGQRIAARSPFPVTRVVGYTDSYLGYLPDEAAYAAETYEAYISLFGPGADHLLVDGVVDLLREAHRS